MKRRSLLLKAGGIVGGGAVVFGSGAFTSSQGDREVTLRVVGDGSAYLALSSGSGDDGNLVSEDANGVVGIDVATVANGTATPGDGANLGTVTALDDLLRMENRGSQQVTVSASFPPDCGLVLFTNYGGPGSIAALDEPGNAVTLAPGASAEVGLALDAGYGTGEIDGTFTDGSTVTVTIEALAT